MRVERASPGALPLFSIANASLPPPRFRIAVERVKKKKTDGVDAGQARSHHDDSRASRVHAHASLPPPFLCSDDERNRKKKGETGDLHSAALICTQLLAHRSPPAAAAETPPLHARLCASRAETGLHAHERARTRPGPKGPSRAVPPGVGAANRPETSRGPCGGAGAPPPLCVV
ncbi:hypothetical protein CDD83_70 [Cordyceps sp. RAO-2017]|nr:hypothetical protein CDD83_70 [Cordyceps sp. RAO-2017]